MKKFLIVLFILLLVPGISKAQSLNSDSSNKTDDIKSMVNKKVDDMNTTDWNSYISKLPNDAQKVLHGKSIKEYILDAVNGKLNINASSFLSMIFGYFFGEVKQNFGLVIKIIVIAILSGIIDNLKSSFSSEGIGEVSYYACYILVIILIVQSLNIMLSYGKQTINDMTSFVQILFPILVTFLVAIGGAATSTIFQPAILLLIEIISTIMKNIILPLILLSAILKILNNISSKVNIDKLGSFTLNICNWTIGIIFTIYMGVLTIKGITASSFDGITIRTAKYAIDNFIPVVGGIFSQSVDTIIGCSVLIKNAVGTVGLLILSLICIFPALKILVMMFLYKLMSSLLQPISDGNIVKCLDDIGSVMTTLFISVIAVGLMFFITITLLITTGNNIFMMR